MEGNPKRLGRYELREVLGRGAMGVVYKAYDSFLDRIVAVKTYRQDIAASEQLRKRFEREVRTAGRLSHPNIVVVHDGGLENDTPFLAMEFIDGPTLEAELARRGRLSTKEALAIVLGVAEGLAFAHQQGVIHRDVKPANILLTPSGEPKVSDFGVAKLMTSESAQTTMAVGTPSYMAPEQIEGKALDARTDVFGLAVLAYELLTGQRPFAAENLPALLYRIMHTDPPPPSSLNPDLPAAVDGVFERALAKDTSIRTADARKFANELRDAFAAPGERTAIVAPARKAEAERPAFEERAAEVAVQTPSRRGPQIAVGVVLLAALGGVIAYLVREGPPSPPSVAVATPTGTPTAIATPTRPPTQVPAVVAPTATAARAPTATPVPPTRIPTETPQPTETAEPTETPTPRPTRVPRPTATPRPAAAEPEEEEPQSALPPSAPVDVVRTVIQVISEPPGADVFVNGVNKGKTPARITDLQPGTYDIELRKEGYSPYRKTARLDLNSEYTIRVTLGSAGLSSQRGYVVVDSTPSGAPIKVNGDPSGQTPATIGLTAGHYVISVESPPYAPQQQTIDVKAGETHRLRFMFDVGR